MKIKGWEKLNGFTYKGYSIVNTAYGVGVQGKYYADVIDLNLPQKPKWELSVLMPDFKFKQDNDITIILWDENKYRATKSVSKNMVSTLTAFRILFEDLVDEVLKLRLISAPRSHSLHTNPINTKASKAGGIVNHINNNGTTIQWQNIQSQAINAMQDLQKQIDKLNNNANN